MLSVLTKPLLQLNNILHTVFTTTFSYIPPQVFIVGKHCLERGGNTSCRHTASDWLAWTVQWVGPTKQHCTPRALTRINIRFVNAASLWGSGLKTPVVSRSPSTWTKSTSAVNAISSIPCWLADPYTSSVRWFQSSPFWLFSSRFKRAKILYPQVNKKYFCW